MRSSRDKSIIAPSDETLATDWVDLKRKARQFVKNIASKVSGFATSIHARARTRARELWPVFLEGFRFHNTWANTFPPFLMGYLHAFRGILIKPLFSGSPVLSEQTVDAFWIKDQIKYGLHQLIDWFAVVFKALAQDIRRLASMFGWLLAPAYQWLSPAFTWLTPAFRGLAIVCKSVLPYIPFVSLALAAMIATGDFWYSENKNFATTLKWLAEVSGSVLLGVGLGLMAWGTAAAMVYTAPLLIGLAAAMVASVGLVKSSYHFYQAVKHPEQWKEHVFTGVKEILKTTISVTACVLTFFGMSMGQDLSRSLLVNAEDLYKSAAVATDVVLAAGGTLTLMMLAPKLYAGCKKLVSQCFGAKEEPAPVVERIISPSDFGGTAKVIKTLELRCETLISEARSDARQEKLGLLRMAKQVWKQEMTYDAFDEAVKKAEKTAYKTGVFHSFWKETSDTRRLVNMTLACHKPQVTPRMRG